MKCSKCQQENTNSANFCSKCGAKLQIVCPQCGTEVEPEDRFCSKCGSALIDTATNYKTTVIHSKPSNLQEQSTSLQKSPTESHRKHHLINSESEKRVLTILFADISGSVKTMANLDPEEAAELVSSVLQTMVEAINRYEGSVNRFIGDSALAFFGTPQAHENDPERAILAALEILQAVQKLGLNATIGINTGEVYLGGIGSEQHQEFTVIGTVANLAARLQGKAKPGQILVGEAVYRHTRRSFEFSPLPLELKGISQAVVAYEVIRRRPSPQKVRGIEGLKADLIGRDKEFSKLKESLGEVIRGRGQMVSIIGEAGIGKSRLISELKQLVLNLNLPRDLKDSEEENVTVMPRWLEGRCFSLGNMTVSYWPFIDIFQQYFAWRPEDNNQARADQIALSLRELANRGDLLHERFEELLPLFGSLLSVQFGNEYDERLKNASPEQIKHQTFIAIQDAFLALAKRQPVILVFEDLHWSDNLSLDLISLLMETLKTVPIFLICGYRPEREHKCWKLRDIASQKCPERYQEIYLRELSSQHIHQLVESLLRIENLPSSMKELILEKSQGNPFFVEEVIRSLIDSEMVYREENVWRAREGIESVTVPESIQGVIMNRVDRLPKDVKNVLQLASVIGRLFRIRLLEHMMPDKTVLEHALGELEDFGLVYQERLTPEKEYSFKHVLAQETVYQNILRRRRVIFHQQIGESIEVIYQDGIEEYYEQLAHHYDKSSKVEKAVEYLLKAGEKARRTYLNEEAIKYLQRALKRLDSSSLKAVRKDWQLEVLKGLGQIYHGIGKESSAEENFRQAIAVGQEMGLSVRELARLYWWLGDVLWWQNRYSELIRIGEEGLVLLGNDTESVEAALMNAHVALGYSNVDRKKSWEFTYRNTQFLQRLPYSEELRPAYIHIVYGYISSDKNVEEAVKWLQTLEQVAIQHHDLRALASFHLHMGNVILLNIGDLNGAISHLQKGLELFTKIGDIKIAGWCLNNIGWAFLLLGDFRKAEECMTKTFEISERVGSRTDIILSYERIGLISLCQGSWEKAINAFNKAAQLHQETGASGIWTTLYLGRTYLIKSRPAEAMKQFEEALNLATTSSVLQPLILGDALSGLNKACKNEHEFRTFCQRFRERHPEIGDSPFIQWFLESTEIQEFPQNFFRDDFVETQQAAPLHSTWTWHDPFGDCSFRVKNGLEIHAANGRNLWRINLSAPRVLQTISGDFAVQTTCIPVSENKLSIGGILLWKDKKNFLILERGRWGHNEISFMGCLRNEDHIMGRGRFPYNRISLRLERLGTRVNALCSNDGVGWFTVGYVDFATDDPVEVGLHAIGSIVRSIYHDAYPEGTAIRFESFQLWT